MPEPEPADIRSLFEQLDAAEREARAIAAGLSEEEGTRRPRPNAWSIAECLDHLATGNRVYVRAMREPVAHARARGRLRRRPAAPGWIGGLFVRQLEPPPRWWSRLPSPRKARPGAGGLGETLRAFCAAQTEVRAFLGEHADLDLNGVRFPNPFFPGIRFSLATGLHVITAHERRHLWQARRVRETLGRTF